MNDEAEQSVSRFYSETGWETVGEITEDARRYDDLREHAKAYVSKCRLRVLRHIPPCGENLLDMASGPIQYDEYLEYSRHFKKRYCVDLSAKALEAAHRRIGSHGVFLHGSFLDIPMEENFFDCTISLHTIYHIDADKQEEAVRKLIHVTKPGKPVIVVYGSSVRSRVAWFFESRLRLFVRARATRTPGSRARARDRVGGATLYAYTHPLGWWQRFSGIATVTILPWRSFASHIQKKLIPNNRIGAKMFEVLFNLEERFPGLFAKHGKYPMIILTKRPGQ